MDNSLFSGQLVVATVAVALNIALIVIQHIMDHLTTTRRMVLVCKGPINRIFTIFVNSAMVSSTCKRIKCEGLECGVPQFGNGKLDSVSLSIFFGKRA